MTKHVEMHSFALSRRSFLVGSSTFGIGVAFGSLPDAALADANGAFAANAWVTIGADDIVTIMSPAVEMGQGIMTALPVCIAEDLDADWSKVRVVTAPDDEKLYGNPKFFGHMVTVGSRATTGYYDLIRIAGAQARKVLLASAATAMKVPVTELTTEPGVVVHAKSGRKMTYGEVAKTAHVPNPPPKATKADLKAPAQFRYIGKDAARVDIPLKVNGTAKYGIDTELPNLIYASVLHPPVQGDKPQQIDDTAAKAVKGVVKVMALPHGVAVIGNTVEGTQKAKRLLKVTWTADEQAHHYSNEAIAADYSKVAGDWGKGSVDMLKEGDASGAIAGAAKVVGATFVNEHVAHCCMEPMNATVVVDGDKVEIWASNQSVIDMKLIGAGVGGTSPDKVKVHRPFLGGGFGRRTDGEEVAEAVFIAKTMPKQPVKVIWSREDDIQNDKWRPLAAQRIEAGLDANGNIVGWRHRIVAQSYLARAIPPLFKKIGGRDIVSAGGGEFRYKMPAHLVEYARGARGMEVGAWRGVAPGYTKFAIEVLLDEIAAHRAVDPVALRLELLKHDPRAVKVIETVAKMADWRRKRDGRALGIGYSDALESYTAIVAEASVDRASGKVIVHHLWGAVDAGVAVQPKNIAAQLEGAMIFGMGAALIEHIDVHDGKVKQANFDTYRVMRMADIPPIEVQVISTDNPPTGIGEAGVSPTAPAIANAVGALTGKRMRHLPMTPARVKEALGAA